MKRVLLSLALAVLLVGTVVVGCTKPAPSPVPTPAPAPSKTLDIGVAAPLTGPTAFLGTQTQDGILLAIDDQNEQGGITIGGQNYTLNPIIRDTKFDLIVSKNVAEELVFEKKVKVIAGPFVFDVIGVQAVTEPNKVIMFGIATVPGATGPKKPYTFFAGWPIEQMYQSTFAYVQKFHPQARTIVSMGPEQPDLPQFIDAAKAICPKYGLNWLDVEKFTLDTKDFMPIVSRALAKNPDIIDTTITGGSMAGVCAVLIKQLGEADFKGLILIPCNTEKEVMDEVVPAKYLNRIVINRADPESPIVSEAYRSFCDRFQKKYNMPANSMAALMYNPVKAFFEFLNGQNNMDTTAWMEGFAKYRWQGLFGFESYWVGKPMLGIDRRVLGPSWVAEWTNGKLEIKWSAPIPYEMFVGE